MPRTVLLLLAVTALVLPSAAVAATPTTTTVTPSAVTSVYGDETLTFLAQVAGTNGVPTGFVQFLVNGEAYTEPRALDALGRAQELFPEFYLDVGDDVSARYLGNGVDESSQGDATFTILPARTQVAVATSPRPTLAGEPVTIIVKVDNASTALPAWGTAALVVDGAVEAEFPVDEGTLTVTGGEDLAAGTHTFEVRFTNPAGDFEPSSGTTTHTVQGRTLPVQPPPPFNPPPPPRLMPPPVATPAPTAPFAVLRHTTKAATGAVSLLTQLPAAGTVTAHASAAGVPKWGTVSKVVTAAGRVTLVVNPSAKARRKLAKGKSVKVTVQLRFQPAAGGAARTLTRRVTVKATKTAKGSRAPSRGSWRLASPSGAPR
ncbi:hypothetical protein C8N24_4492 [Solirubrobacter pauli]|uniref:Ig-like domain-containing protein n=1 Tax=Solirubrobacter pauli TaxID=166793 RepID=A0A660L4K3_9ACTN|nr:hypothetical protein [Solirubrobacter pauli]RKQ86480.1 hypothetical protein C8N24_4492 [Solirubrobacter pauli]